MRRGEAGRLLADAAVSMNAILGERSDLHIANWRATGYKTRTESNVKGKEGRMTDESKVKGPASYFPSIEKTYGHPVTHWFTILKAAGELKHMELVNLLKTEYKIGHGHANALVAYYLKNP